MGLFNRSSQSSRSIQAPPAAQSSDDVEAGDGADAPLTPPAVSGWFPTLDVRNELVGMRWQWPDRDDSEMGLSGRAESGRHVLVQMNGAPSDGLFQFVIIARNVDPSDAHLLDGVDLGSGRRLDYNEDRRYLALIEDVSAQCDSALMLTVAASLLAERADELVGLLVSG